MLSKGHRECHFHGARSTPGLPYLFFLAPKLGSQRVKWQRSVAIASGAKMGERSSGVMGGNAQSVR